MLIKELSLELEKIESIHSRNEITALLGTLLKELSREELGFSVYLLQGRVAPKYLPIEFNFASKNILKAIAEVSNKELEIVQAKYNEVGDIGLVAKFFSKDIGNKITLTEIYDALKKIALTSGKDSVKAKTDLYIDLFNKLDPVSIKFVTRMILGNLRLGMSDKTVLDAISFAISGDKSQKDSLERAYGIRNDISKIATIAIFDGIEEIQKLKVEVGTPVASKLVEREKDVESIIERHIKTYIQPKFDGLRCQIHFSKKGFNDEDGITFVDQNNVRLFSRNLESLTGSFPDIVSEVQKLKVDSIVLDSEVVGVNEETLKTLQFQDTIKRKRKHGVDAQAASTKIRVNIFDILFLNGKDLTLDPLESRLEILEKIIKDANSKVLLMAETTLVESAEDLSALFVRYVDEGLEGLIAKKADTIYEAGTRNFDWIKFKRSTNSKLNDTVDAVVLGYYLGRGVRVKFGIGRILVGLYNKDKDEYHSLAKVGTGFKDEDFVQFKKELDEITRKDKPVNYVVSKNLACDVWVDPKIVVEIEADEITTSENHAVEYEGKKFSLRFPRIKKWGRDKLATDTTSEKELSEMYNFRFKK